MDAYFLYVARINEQRPTTRKRQMLDGGSRIVRTILPNTPATSHNAALGPDIYINKVIRTDVGQYFLYAKQMIPMARRQQWMKSYER